jgi:glyoxylase-like metal-dependent hydrolase (beta-lactamase superfamily II)
MILETYKVGPVECNCSIVASKETGEAVVVDPGGDPELLLERIKALGVKVKYILITHAHFDHVIAARVLKEATGAKVCLHRKDIWLYRIMPLQYRMFGAKDAGRPAKLDILLKDGDSFRCDDLTVNVLHTPGHSPGSCCFHMAAQKLLFSGDTLFQGSVGQWAFPGGSFDALVRSITEKLFTLPDDTRVIPGHRDETTIGVEKATNPYLTPEAIAKYHAEEAKRPGTIKAFFLMVFGAFFRKRSD